MQFFQLRLLLAILLGITTISAVSTYFDVLAHRHMQRTDMERRTRWFASAILPQLERGSAAKDNDWPGVLHRVRPLPDQPALVVCDKEGVVLGAAGDMPALYMFPARFLQNALDRGQQSNAFVRIRDAQGTPHLWLEEVFPLQAKDAASQALVLVANADFIAREGMAIWQRNFLRIGAIVVLVVVVTLAMVRRFLLKPILRAADWLRRLRRGEASLEEGSQEFRHLVPLAREVTSLAEHLQKARSAAEREAQLRDRAERLWTAERLAAHVREQLGAGKLFVISNREPYMHVRQGRETRCVTPPSGVVTAIEPILQACDGIWIAHGSGNRDFEHTDERGSLRVPPLDERYTLRRVSLSDEELAGYYEGFANEGLWPLCHIAHTRPIFRACDWEHYRAVNQRFADLALEEMQGVDEPVVLVQDYHFALLPRMIEQARPEARIAIFWHIPWPNAEAFGICPWKAEILDGLLGADVVGFHLQAHCNNFMETVDRTLEARTDWQQFSIRRKGHLSSVRTYPISVAWDPSAEANGQPAPRHPQPPPAVEDSNPFLEFEFDAQQILLGVDRMDYTKGIPERLLALQQLLADHPWYQERIVFLQVAVPSRSSIPSYARLQTEVVALTNAINRQFQTPAWKPIHLIQRQCSRQELLWLYRKASLCLVTSLHDGMNLVAKEYVEAREDCGGVLVLSCFTGAAQELKDALIVNPYDTLQVSQAIHTGLEMPQAEQHLRMERMRGYVREHNVYRWASDLVTDLCAIRVGDQQSTDTLLRTGQGS